MIENRPLAAVIVDIRLSGPFRFEGLDLVSFVRARSASTRIIAMSGSGADGLASEANRRGAFFLEKPFEMERLHELIPLPADRESEGRVSLIPTLAELMHSDAIVPHFQPVVELEDPAKICAFEALSRVPGQSIVDLPAALFRYADRKQLAVDLTLVCLERALHLASSIPSRYLTLLNVDSRAFDDRRLVPSLTQAAERASVPLDRVVLELTEQHPFVETPAAFAAVEQLRKRGVAFAFDDVGVAYSHLPFIARIRPRFLKISQQFGTGFEGDPVRTKLVRNIVELAAEFDCEVILEGIEAQKTAEAARILGIRYGQGFFFGRPAPVSAIKA